MKLTKTQLREIIKEEIKSVTEAWKGDADIKKMDKYGKAEMTKAELCARRTELLAKDDRTEEESTELRRINFALRSRQKGPKFGKVTC